MHVCIALPLCDLNTPLEPVTVFIDKGVVYEITTTSKPKRPSGCLLERGYPFMSPLFHKSSVFFPTLLRAPVRPWWWKWEGPWNWARHGAKRLCTSCVYIYTHMHSYVSLDERWLRVFGCSPLSPVLAEIRAVKAKVTVDVPTAIQA